ncbi:hypothetical protein [Candidatus Nitrosocosmicus arcticus]|uniref:Uncharacterized protein n=1 Tax=Candidatus Nitrosocosmicus arcticus TaxID=2035267 RepID=A0A557SR47_9ARCH|nr:hypothetical protein [Candidatus Nitrosocosmicus arcticus]TVP39081.1 hypothetical protein NARC_210025 [Candidatus Nitrosocosmicus arcticus]
MGKKNPMLRVTVRKSIACFKGIPITTIAIRHDLGFEEVKPYYREYLSLQGHE